MLRTILILVILLIQPIAFADIRERPVDWASQMIGANLDNFYRLDKNIYRSEQPESESFELLATFGVKEVLNLRQHHTDDREARRTSLSLHQVKMNAGSVSEQQIYEALDKIKTANGPILIHCWHGSDRTGVVSAAYRVVFQGWPKAEAVEEFVSGGFGYHQSVFPGLVDLIQTLDVESLRERLGL